MIFGVTAGFGLIVAGLAVWLTTAQAARGRLGLNSAAGIRTAATMASSAAWQAGHQAAARPAKLIGLGAVAAGVLLALTGVLQPGDESGAVGMVLFALGYGGLIAGSVWIAQVANRAARAAG